MANISAAMVKDLRDRTGLGMMECKKALKEAGGDIEKAIELDERLDEIEVVLIYGDGNGVYESFASESLKPYLSFPVE